MAKQPPQLNTGLPQVIIHVAVAKRFTQEIRAHPQVEVGGKYVGFLRGAGRYQTLGERLRAMGELTLEVIDYLDDGPEAQRTPSFHLGDARRQTARFRELETQEPSIEHLGSWHSHHPNGLAELSSLDIRGYQETVNGPGHNHDFFFVSLGIDLNGFSSARHYLFVRGGNRHYEFQRASIKVVDHLHPPVSDSATTERPDVSETEKVGTSNEAADQDEKQVCDDEPQPSVVERKPEFEPAVPQHSSVWPVREDSQRPSEARRDPNFESRSVPGWSESQAGRDALREEYALLRRPELAHLRLSINQGRLLVRGPVDTSIGRVSVSLLYPSTVDRQDGLLKLATIDEPLIDTSLSGPLARGLEGVLKTLKYFVENVTKLRTATQEKRRLAATIWNALKGE